MAYTYYQTSMPHWGTQEFQFTRPPSPRWQPQPHWTGLDYYRAHAAYDDPGLFQSIIGRLSVAWGTGFHEARHWHRRVYSGQVNLSQVLPVELGSASAYEAYRYWKYDHPLYEPLGGEREREREAMVGMAIAEATHLWQYTGRPFDNLGLRETCETAAGTACQIADRVLALDSGYGHEPSGYSRSDYSQSDYSHPHYDDKYSRMPSIDSHASYPRSSRHLRRTSSVNSLHRNTYVVGTPSYTTPTPYMTPGLVPSAATTMPGGYTQPTQAVTVVPGGATYVPANAPTYGVQPTPYATTYQTGYPMVAGVAPSAYGGGYTQGTAVTPGYGALGYGNMPGQIPPGSTIIIRQPRRQQHHHHHHRARSASFSSHR